MGARGSKRCLCKEDPRCSLVPSKDPLTPCSLRQRIVHGEIFRDFDITGKVLGTGYSGKIRLAIDRRSMRQVAVKQFSKRRLKPHRVKLLQGEVEVNLRLDHPNICRLFNVYEGKKDVWLVIELCACELYSRLCNRKVYQEQDAADAMIEMLQAVSYLHSHHIVHRDLKLENWMYDRLEQSNEERLKLIDFGFSRVLGFEGEKLDMPCGTLHYTGPDVLMRNYTSKADCWSLGVIAYMLLVGRPPFKGSTAAKLAKEIMNAQVPKDDRWWSISSAAREFVEQLLQKDPEKRPDVSHCLAHRWIVGASGASNASTSSGSSSSSEIGLDVLRSLKLFAQASRLRRAALMLLAYGFTSKELQELEQSFVDMDRSSCGKITSEQFTKVFADYCETAGRPEPSVEEVRQIFESLDVYGLDEVRYTPFVAAMLASKVQLHEDKFHDVFEAFDVAGTGYITSDGLVQLFAELAPDSCFSKEDAEQWIQEVDFKGNGMLDYSEFIDALTGRRLWSMALDQDGDVPTITVFDNEDDGKPRGMSDSYACPTPKFTRIRFGLAAVIVDGNGAAAAQYGRVRSFSSPTTGERMDYSMQVRTVPCGVTENYFR